MFRARTHAAPLPVGSAPAPFADASEEARKRKQQQRSRSGDAACAWLPPPRMDPPSDIECAICLGSELVDPCRTPCGHRFCSACLEQALANDCACPLCRGRVSVYSAVRESTGAPLQRPEVSTIWGSQFVQNGRLGLASYHFAADGTRAWIAYDPAVVPDSWRLDDGSRMPPQKDFEQFAYDAHARAFVGTVRWEPAALDGHSRWEYRMELDEAFSRVAGGSVRAFNAAGALVEEMRFGAQLHYRRVRTSIFDAVFVQLPPLALALPQLSPRDRVLLVGRASYHFSRTSSYISYATAREAWRADDGAPLPARKYFENASYDAATRTFRGTVDWSAAPLRGSVRWEYEMRFDAHLRIIEGGTVRSVFADGSHELKQFGEDLHYIALDPVT